MIMAGLHKFLRIFLICVACTVGLYCAFIGYRSLYPNDYSMTEWRQHLKQHLYDKSVKKFEERPSENRMHRKCTLREVKLSTKRLPVTGLASFPGSGNTWTRHLIQQLTGIGTSSEYCDKELHRKGFPFECYKDRNRVVVVKAHESKFFQPYEKLILLIRNPFDAFLSMTHVLEVGHTGRTETKNLKERTDKEFDELVHRYIRLIGNTIEQFHGPVYILRYDKLKTNMAEELQNLALFLNVNVSQSDIDCTVKMQEGHYHRKGNISEHLNTLKSVYSSEQLLIIREVARFSEKMIQRAYGLYLNLGAPTEQMLFNSDSRIS